MITADAWVPHRQADPGFPPRMGKLHRKELSFEEPEDDEALVEPLFASWEANIAHAISRQPIDVCDQRDESQFLRDNGITAIDRRRFPLPACRGRDDQVYRRDHGASEEAFLATVRELSDGLGAAIFIDNIGAALYRTTLKALARKGVLATVGWKHGMQTSILRASECIKRHLHVHTHVWRYEDCPEIRDYMERTAWLPDADSLAIYTFDEAPQLADEYSSGKISSYFPLLRVNPP